MKVAPLRARGAFRGLGEETICREEIRRRRRQSSIKTPNPSHPGTAGEAPARLSQARRLRHYRGPTQLRPWLGALAGSALLLPSLLTAAPAELPYRPGASFAATVLALRSAVASTPGVDPDALRHWQERLAEDFPVQTDWILQDVGADSLGWLTATGRTEIASDMAVRAVGELGETGAALRRELEQLRQGARAADQALWLDLYLRAAAQRRALRLQTALARAPKMVFTKHPTIRPSFFAYTEGQSDAQNERHFVPGAELCLLEWQGATNCVRTLLADPTGAIRDPAVSWDGTKVAFAWKKSLNEDDYHLYEMDVASGKIRQVTAGLGFADYEPAYLPNGDLIFASTRCVQTVDCWWTEVSNLYTCDKDGRFLRRLGFDQVHTVFPSVLADGRVIYTRWDYNDRGQVFPQPLFQMNPDGTGQSEFYGNNSWFPTTIAHARGIPGTQKVLAILCGHHSTQAGKLAIIDPSRGRQENSGVQLVAPVRPTRAERIDSYGQEGELFQYPYALNEREFIVTYAPRGWQEQGRQNRRRGDAAFAIYWMDLAGHRELLVTDPRVACQQAVPLVARAAPALRPSGVDHRQTNGTYYIQDIYAGPSLAGVPRGTVKKLRVVALDFRPAGIGNNGSSGPGGGALISTPIAIGNGAWDSKTVLGQARVHADGSAFFSVPARTPVYFQALDEAGRAVQTMRSWSTLQPGENQSCVGCHEAKNAAPTTGGYRGTLALKAGAQTLEPFYGPSRGFSFPREIQPILDRHCVRCHSDRGQKMEVKRVPVPLHRQADPDWSRAQTALTLTLQDADRSNAPALAVTNRPVFSLLADTVVDRLAKRRWSDAYLNLTLAQPANHDWEQGSFVGQSDGRMVNWVGSQSIPAPLPPYAAGSTRSELLPLLAQGHGGVRLSREELEKLACWIDLLVPYSGDYVEANTWTEAELAKYRHYLAKRQRMEATEGRNIAEMLHSQGGPGEAHPHTAAR